MLQVLSGLPLSAPLEEINALYRVHMRSMWLGANLERARAVGSQLLAFLLASLEPHAGGEACPAPRSHVKIR